MTDKRKSRAYWIAMWGVVAVMVVTGFREFGYGHAVTGLWALIAAAWAAQTVVLQRAMERYSELTDCAIREYAKLVDHYNELAERIKKTVRQA